MEAEEEGVNGRVLALGGVDVGFDDGRADGIDAHALLCRLVSRGLGESDHGELCGVIDGCGDYGTDAERGGVVHDDAATGFDDGGNLVFQAEGNAADVNSQGAVDDVRRDLSDRTALEEDA